MSRTNGGAAGGAVLGLGLALLLTAGLVPARGDTLRWKFKAGESLHYQMDQTTITEVKAGGQQIKTTLNQVLDTTWLVGKVADDGSAELSQSIDRIKTKIDSAFGTFEFDSGNEKAAAGPIAAQVVPLLKALVGAKFTYTMSPNGALSNVRVPAGLVEKLKQSGSTAGSVGMFSEEGLKNMISESSLELPKDGAEKGKTWTRQTKIPSPPAGSLVVDKTYTVLGPEKGVEQIGVDMKMTLDAAPDANVQLTLANQDGKGTFQFDPAAGRVVGSELRQKVEMVIKAMNQEFNQSTDTTTKMTLVGDKAAAPK